MAYVREREEEKRKEKKSYASSSPSSSRRREDPSQRRQLLPPRLGSIVVRDHEVSDGPLSCSGLRRRESRWIWETKKKHGDGTHLGLLFLLLSSSESLPSGSSLLSLCTEVVVGIRVESRKMFEILRVEGKGRRRSGRVSRTKAGGNQTRTVVVLRPTSLPSNLNSSSIFRLHSFRVVAFLLEWRGGKRRGSISRRGKRSDSSTRRRGM